jgi:hypothetical protein
MKYLTRAGTLSVVAAALLTVTACSSDIASPTESQAPSAKKDKTTVKFTFDNVTFPDGVVGVIFAGSKDADNSVFTHCDYSTENGDVYLGMFESDQFSSKSADEVLGFCLSHYADRQ